MQPILRRPRGRIAVAILFIGALAGCGPHIECMDFPGDGGECGRFAEAAQPEVPPGARTLTVVGGVRSAIRAPSHLVVACYPDGTAVAVHVTLTADGAEFGPSRRDELPFECDR
jgi:hypothetical protein